MTSIKLSDPKIGEAVGVVVGRFQVDELHSGHKALLDYVSSMHKRLLILIGIRDTPPTKQNPLSFEVRERMLREAYPNAVILPIEDKRINEVWSEQLDKIIIQAFGHSPAVLYCGRNGFSWAYTGKHPVQIYHSPPVSVTSSAIRDEIGKNPEHDKLFRKGIIYAMENLPHRIYMTVDIALVKPATNADNDKQPSVLMIKKPGEPSWRFPGGFVEPEESISKAAIRELFEETQILADPIVEFVGDFNMKDWRLRDATGDVSHKTFLFIAHYTYGAAKASDDVSEAEWFTIGSLGRTVPIMEEHEQLIQALQRKYGLERLSI